MWHKLKVEFQSKSQVSTGRGGEFLFNSCPCSQAGEWDPSEHNWQNLRGFCGSRAADTRCQQHPAGAQPALPSSAKPQGHCSLGAGKCPAVLRGRMQKLHKICCRERDRGEQQTALCTSAELPGSVLGACSNSGHCWRQPWMLRTNLVQLQSPWSSCAFHQRQFH